MEDCIFCEIVAGARPASIVYQDEVALAVMDIAPINIGHVLVLPKRHAAGLADLDEPTGMHLFQVAQRLARAVRQSGLRCEGVNLWLADGRVAFQSVFHVHVHVLPRFSGDGFKFIAVRPPTPSRAELDASAAAIRRAYQALRV